MKQIFVLSKIALDDNYECLTIHPNITDYHILKEFDNGIVLAHCLVSEDIYNCIFNDKRFLCESYEALYRDHFELAQDILLIESDEIEVESQYIDDIGNIVVIKHKHRPIITLREFMKQKSKTNAKQKIKAKNIKIPHTWSGIYIDKPNKKDDNKVEKIIDKLPSKHFKKKKMEAPIKDELSGIHELSRRKTFTT